MQCDGELVAFAQLQRLIRDPLPTTLDWFHFFLQQNDAEIDSPSTAGASSSSISTNGESTGASTSWYASRRQACSMDSNWGKMHQMCHYYLFCHLDLLQMII